MCLITMCILLLNVNFFSVFAGITNSDKINDNYRKYITSKEITKGSTQLKWMVAGNAFRCIRSYWIHIPASYDGSEPVPLVFVLHGSANVYVPYPFHFLRESWIERYTNFSEKADKEKFIVIYPNAKFFYSERVFAYDQEIFPAWQYLFTDDVGFIKDLIDNMENNYNINSSRIYITGLSSGAIMSYSLGSHLSDKVAAIAPVAGTIGGNLKGEKPFYYVKIPEDPVPAIIFHGTNDENVPYDGSLIVASVNESVSFWVNHTGCNSEPNISISDSGKIIKKTYTNKSNNMEVILYTIVGGGHWWPGNDDNLGLNVLNDTIQEIDANDLIWEFFDRHPKR